MDKFMGEVEAYRRINMPTISNFIREDEIVETAHECDGHRWETEHLSPGTVEKLISAGAQLIAVLGYKGDNSPYQFIIFVEKAQRWFGWDLTRYSGEEVFQLQSREPGHVMSAPRAPHGWNPVMPEVTEGEFIACFASVFFFSSSAESTDDPLVFARKMGETEYEGWQGGAKFGTLATPNGRGWIYQTISRRQLIWVPAGEEGVVFFRGLEKSYFLRSCFGGTDLLSEPEWLEEALSKVVLVKRPVDYGDGQPVKEVDNSDFFAEIAS